MFFSLSLISFLPGDTVALHLALNASGGRLRLRLVLLLELRFQKLRIKFRFLHMKCIYCLAYEASIEWAGCKLVIDLECQCQVPSALDAFGSLWQAEFKIWQAIVEYSLSAIMKIKLSF